MSGSVYQTFGNKLRVRVCGLCVENNQLLMVNHAGITAGDFWAPPGGGLQFGETVEACLKREFLEETGLDIEIQDLLFTCEVIRLPLHAVEMFFTTKVKHGKLMRGIDPEMEQGQIIQDVKFVPWAKIDGLNPASKHGIFSFVSGSSKILDLRGHLKL